MKKTLNISCRKALLPAVSALLLAATACNSDSETSGDGDVAVTASNVAVRKFSLKADSKVCANLDSVFFSIDLNKGLIFNADSLPKGSDISKLVPVVAFSSTLSEAEIVMRNADGSEIKTVNYLTQPTDSIDFTKDVALKVKSFDGTNSFEYHIKVNVHQQNPDSMAWGGVQRGRFPSRLDAPVAQKTVVKDATAYSIIRESDNSLTLSRAADLFSNSWTSAPLSLPFAPDITSFTATDKAFFILSTDGTLYTSADASAWTVAASGWKSVIGAYQSDLLGIKDDGGVLRHVVLSEGTEKTGDRMTADFPLTARTALAVVPNKWASSPTAFFVGGILADGRTVSAATWAFDGSSWTTIDAVSTPALEGATLIKYVAYRKKTATKKEEYNAWIVLGGILADGSYNRDLYTTFDNGVTWTKASKAMALPDIFPDLAGADGVVEPRRLEANLDRVWTDMAAPLSTRGQATVTGTDISWECPYIYIIGGNGSDGSLSPEIWRGVLERLRFTPII